MKRIVFGPWALALCAACGDLPGEQTAQVSQAWTPLSRSRPCRSDAIYVDVPIQASPTWPSNAFLPVLENDLQFLANGVGLPWFCGQGEVTCPAGSVVVQARPVLPQRNAPAFRSDGHLRFYRVTFHDSADQSQLSLRDEGQCEAVQAVRARFIARTGALEQNIYVGRECDATAQGVEGAASNEMLTWHLPRIGLSTSAAAAIPAPNGLQTVDLALIDSGVLPSVGNAPGGIDVASQTNLNKTSGGEKHGTAMAIFARQIAPRARLHSMRVLGGDQAGTSGPVSRAVDLALFSGNAARPLIVNLSLGWPSELNRPAPLASPGCSTREDPFGEAVRYALDVARRLDNSGTRAVFVTASAGNQPRPTPPSLFPQTGAGPAPLTCGAQTLRGNSWFFPAQWHHLDTCRNPLGAHYRVAFGVSVVTDRELIAGNAIPLAEAPLVAPGQHVYAAHPNALQTPVAPTCGGSNTVFPAEPHLPASMTGSSVGSAMVAAAAARVQSRRLAQGRLPLRWNTLARVMYFAGDALCRNTPAGVPVRRLNVARLDRLITSAICEPLVTCAANDPSIEPIRSDLLVHCKQELAACGLETLDENDNLVVECNQAPVSVSWPANYRTEAVQCSEDTQPGAFQDAANCPPQGCPFEEGIHRSLIGSLGPQPNEGGCLDCNLAVSYNSSDITLNAELNPDFDGGTWFENPILILDGLDLQGIKATHYFPIDLKGSVWNPGGSYKIEISNAPAMDWAKTLPLLDLTVVPPDDNPSNDVSPLRLEIQ